MPFFPRVLIQRVRLHHRIRQRFGFQRLPRQFLQSVPPTEQFGALATQFAGQLRGGNALGNAAQQQQDLRRAFLRTLQDGLGVGVEDATAVVAAIIEHGIAPPTMDVPSLAVLAAGADQPVRMEQRE